MQVLVECAALLDGAAHLLAVGRDAENAIAAAGGAHGLDADAGDGQVLGGEMALVGGLGGVALIEHVFEHAGEAAVVVADGAQIAAHMRGQGFRSAIPMVEGGGSSLSDRPNGIKWHTYHPFCTQAIPKCPDDALLVVGLQAFYYRPRECADFYS